MSVMKRYFSGNRNGILVVCYLAYLVMLAITITHHELWGDEIHTWNLAKAAHTYSDLLSMVRYEGHPPLWHTLLWLITRFTHQLIWLQAAQFLMAALAVFVLLFRSPIPLFLKILIPAGYYFLFEYGVLSRNYMPGVLIAFLICTLLSSKKKGNVVYYPLLLLLTMSHMLGILLAGSLHLYFLLLQKELHRKNNWLHIVTGVLVALPAIYMVAPPSDSETNFAFWVDHWNTNQLMIIVAAPVKSMLAIPAWWSDHLWNTNFLFEPGGPIQVSGTMIILLSASLIVLVSVILGAHRKSLYLFLSNLLLTSIVAIVFPLTSTRYVGYIYISFIVAVWLMFSETKVSSFRQALIFLFFAVQIPGGIITAIKDIRYTFSNAGKAGELLKEVPPQEMVVSDYWCLNNLVAFLDKPFYCLEVNKVIDHIIWDQQLSERRRSRKPYTNGADNLFAVIPRKSFYLMSTYPVEILDKNDTAFTRKFIVAMIDKREGSIEKYGALYLYRISKRP